jgi:cysteine desulfurase
VSAKQNIFLDYNATTPILPSALEALNAAYSLPLNASSIHYFGREGKKLLQNARNSIALSLDADGAEIIFTSTGTEANNLAINGLKESKKIIVSAIEHPSILKPAETLGAAIISANSDGTINLSHLEELLHTHQAEKPLVSVTYANNETGVVQPINEIAELVFKYNGFFHCDASQAVGKVPFSFHNTRADIVTISAHKFGGAKGAAALIMKKGLHLQAHITGGGQEKGFRAGTENLPAIAAMAAALKEIITKNPSNLIENDSQLQKTLQNSLQNHSTSLDFWSERVKYHIENEIVKIAPSDCQTQFV